MVRKKHKNIQLEYIERLSSWVYFCLDCNIMVTVDTNQVKGIRKHSKLYCMQHHEVHYGSDEN
jgi:predicted RNA-binding protein with PUA domain